MFRSPRRVLRLCRRALTHLQPTGRRLGAGGGNTIGLQNHKRSNSPQKVIRSYTPACAKPHVRCWHFLILVYSSVLQVPKFQNSHFCRRIQNKFRGFHRVHILSPEQHLQRVNSTTLQVVSFLSVWLQQ